MKNILKYALVVLTVFGIMFLFMSFAMMDLNPINWGMGVRLLYVLLSMVFSFIMCLVTD